MQREIDFVNTKLGCRTTYPNIQYVKNVKNVSSDNKLDYILACLFYDCYTELFVSMLFEVKYVLYNMLDTIDVNVVKMYNLYTAFDLHSNCVVTIDLNDPFDQELLVRPITYSLRYRNSDNAENLYPENSLEIPSPIFILPYCDNHNVYVLNNLITYPSPNKNTYLKKLNVNYSMDIDNRLNVNEESQWWIDLHCKKNIVYPYDRNHFIFLYVWQYAYTHGLTMLLSQCENMCVETDETFDCLVFLYKYTDVSFYDYVYSFSREIVIYRLYKILHNIIHRTLTDDDRRYIRSSSETFKCCILHYLSTKYVDEYVAHDVMECVLETKESVKKHVSSGMYSPSFVTMHDITLLKGKNESLSTFENKELKNTILVKTNNTDLLKYIALYPLKSIPYYSYIYNSLNNLFSFCF